MKRVFISFKMEDKPQVDGVRLMAWNDRFDLEFFDESVRIPYDSVNAAYIRSRIKGKIQRSSITLCLLGVKTHESKWVNWELETFIAEGNKIVLMGLPRGPGRLLLPAAVRGREWYLWNPQHLHQLLS